jgi:hypothetical protein
MSIRHGSDDNFKAATDRDCKLGTVAAATNLGVRGRLPRTRRRRVSTALVFEHRLDLIAQFGRILVPVG